MMFDTIRKKILNIDDLTMLRSKNPEKKIVFCTGCYDLLQSGHAVFFNQCKAHGDILVVGIGRDGVIRRLKGQGRPVNPEINRLYLVAALQDVDYACLNDEELGEGKIDFASVVGALRPDVFVLNDDDGGVAEKRALCAKWGMRLELVPRVVPPELEATSTTRIIEKINFSYRVPLRIDFAGGWSDVPLIMGDRIGYVTNVAISPHVELGNGKYNFSGYPRGSGLSTSTAVKLLEMISANGYECREKSLEAIAEDLFDLENCKLHWPIGRQDQYSIVYGGLHCFEFGPHGAKIMDGDPGIRVLENFKRNLLLVHSGQSRNAQSVVEEVYANYRTDAGAKALAQIADCGINFWRALCQGDFAGCAKVMEQNFECQKALAPASSSKVLDGMYSCAKDNGALGGKICGAGGGGAFIFYCSDPERLTAALKREFVDCFEIDFEFEYRSVKELNHI